jgi:hypothetical protein
MLGRLIDRDSWRPYRPEWRPVTAIADFVRRWRTLLVAMLVLLHAAVIAMIWFAPTFKTSIASSSIAAETGTAYIVQVPFGKAFPYALPADGMTAPDRSKLVLFEDGRALGPAHSPHVLIRERGTGQYSHWTSVIIFSTSDGSDPRTNGRAYSVASPTALAMPLQLALLVVFVAADLLLFILFNRDILLFCRSRAPVLLGCLALSTIAAAVLAAAGAFGTLVVAADGAPEDAALVVHVIQHACIGWLISAGFWAAGAGMTRLVLRDPEAGLPQILIPAFPVGLSLLAALVAVSLVVPQGRAIALALWVVCLLPLFSWRPARREIRNAFKAAVAITPFAMFFGMWLALLWHGPTDTLPGSPSGDVSFYAGEIWSLADRPYPSVDLGYEKGGSYSYFNGLFPALGAALLPIPGFDPFLYLIAGGGTAYVLLSAVMLHLYIADRVPRSPDAFAVLVLVLSCLAAANYPYWVVESIPVVFVPALVIAVWWMTERGRVDFRWSIVATIAGLGGSVLSKVTTAALLAPLGATGLWKQFRLVPYWARAVALAAAAVFGVYCFAMLAHYLPFFAAIASAGPESFRKAQWWFASRDVAALVLVLLAWRIADARVAMALTIGLSTSLLFSYLFRINFICVLLLLGLMVFADPARRSRVLALVAFALALPAVILADPAGISTGAVWIVCVGGAVLVALSSAVRTGDGSSVLTLRTAAMVAATTLTVSAIGLAGIMRGNIILASGWHSPGRELTPEVKDIWSAVRRLTPHDALIFTDQVDETIDLTGGWNTYAYSGQRQIYLSSYYTAPALRNDRSRLREVLAVNDEVLRGARRPADVPTRSHHDNVFAVVSKSRTVPAGWKPVYDNKAYAIFQIAPL